MEKENQRVAISKRLLKEALLRLLKEKDISQISITELCQEAEINRATFYRHYSVPQDVLVDIETELLDKAQHIAPRPTSAKDAMPYLEKLFTFVYDNMDVVRILMQSRADDNLIHILDLCNFSVLKTKLNVADNPPLDKATIKLLTAFIGGGGYYLIRAWLMDDIDKSPKEIAQFTYELLNRNLDSYLFGK